MANNMQTRLFTPVIRYLGLYQPFASLMLHGKIETRWCNDERKAPFPLGKYLLYSTKKSYTDNELLSIVGKELYPFTKETIRYEKTKSLNGYALCLGDLVKVAPMHPTDALKCFVKYEPPCNVSRNGLLIPYTRQALLFINIVRIKPFEFKYGKQGVGILKEKEHASVFEHLNKYL